MDGGADAWFEVAGPQRIAFAAEAGAVGEGVGDERGKCRGAVDVAAVDYYPRGVWYLLERSSRPGPLRKAPHAPTTGAQP